MFARLRRSTLSLFVALALVSPATAAADESACVARTLVLAALPAEIDPLLAATSVSATRETAESVLYLGTIDDRPVALTLTGIGVLNAEAVTRAALDALTPCGVDAVVFSGVSGGIGRIGDVAIPTRWTLDGSSWFDVDPALHATASAAARDAELSRDVPLGDAACVGTDPGATVVRMPHEPVVRAGGLGRSTDPFGERRLPCYPGGGDVFGCRPCRAPGASAEEAGRAVTGTLPFIDPSFFFDFFADPPSVPPGFAAVDMETAASAREAARAQVPFIAFRALSDGDGDPLMLPGFPFQFFAYRRLAANNAAAVTLAFLRAPQQ